MSIFEMDVTNASFCINKPIVNHMDHTDFLFHHTLLDGGNVRLNWNIESDMNVNWIKFKNCLSLY